MAENEVPRASRGKPLSDDDLRGAVEDLRALPGVAAGLIHLESGFEGLVAVRFSGDEPAELRAEELAVVDSLRARAPEDGPVADEAARKLLAQLLGREGGEPVYTLLSVGPLGAATGFVVLCGEGDLAAAAPRARLVLDTALARVGLRRAGDLFSDLLAVNEDAILVLDPEDRVVEAGDAARSLFGPGIRNAALTDLLGPEVSVLVTTGGSRRVGPVRLPGSAGEFEISVRRRTGDAGRILVVHDVTETLRLREQLIHSEKLSVLGELLSGVAHELNNPLTAILGFAQILEALNEGEFSQEVGYLREEAMRASRIVKNLLTFSRRLEPRREPDDVNDVVRRTVALRAYDLEVRNIQVTLDLDPKLPRSMMDRGQMQQVVLNLLNNAEFAIHSERDRGAVRISTEHRDGMIVLTVEDDGPGIGGENRDRVFDPFFSTKPSGKGTGLGLPICAGIVRDHGGELRLDPTFEDGARFQVILPVEPWRPGAVVRETD